jgi:hypothetical protein
LFTQSQQRSGDAQVLEVAARELVVGDDLNLALALLGDLDGLAEVADAPVDLDLLVQELLEGRDIEDLVAGGLGGVDDELDGQLVSDSNRHTFRVADSPSSSPWGPSWRRTSSAAPEGD